VPITITAFLLNSDYKNARPETSRPGWQWYPMSAGYCGAVSNNNTDLVYHR